MENVLVKFCYEFPFSLNKEDYLNVYKDDERKFLLKLLKNLTQKKLNLKDLQKRFNLADFRVKILPCIKFLYQYLHLTKVTRYETSKLNRKKLKKTSDNYDYVSNSFLYILQNYDIKNMNIIDTITKIFAPCSSIMEFNLLLSLVKSFGNIKIEKNIIMSPKEEKKMEQDIKYQEMEWWVARGKPFIKVPFWARRISDEKPKSKLDNNSTKVSSYFLD